MRGNTFPVLRTRWVTLFDKTLSWQRLITHQATYQRKRSFACPKPEAGELRADVTRQSIDNSTSGSATPPRLVSGIAFDRFWQAQSRFPTGSMCESPSPISPNRRNWKERNVHCSWRVSYMVVGGKRTFPTRARIRLQVRIHLRLQALPIRRLPLRHHSTSASSIKRDPLW